MQKQYISLILHFIAALVITNVCIYFDNHAGLMYHYATDSVMRAFIIIAHLIVFLTWGWFGFRLGHILTKNI